MTRHPIDEPRRDRVNPQDLIAFLALEHRLYGVEDFVVAEELAAPKEPAEIR